MKVTSRTSPPLLGLLLSTTTLLYGCGGSSPNPAQPVISANIASAVSTFRLEAPFDPGQSAPAIAAPSFHVAPVLLHAPGNVDAIDNAASVRQMPALHSIPAAYRHLSSRRLTLQILTDASQEYDLSLIHI